MTPESAPTSADPKAIVRDGYDRVSRAYRGDMLEPGGWFFAILGKQAWTGTEDDWHGVKGATMYWSHADLATYRRWFVDAGLEIVEEGTQPEKGTPGFAVLIARRSAGAEG